MIYFKQTSQYLPGDQDNQCPEKESNLLLPEKGDRSLILSFRCSHGQCFGKVMEGNNPYVLYDDRLWNMRGKSFCFEKCFNEWEMPASLVWQKKQWHGVKYCFSEQRKFILYHRTPSSGVTTFLLTTRIYVFPPWHQFLAVNHIFDTDKWNWATQFWENLLYSLDLEHVLVLVIRISRTTKQQ
jgi:hypothetical protein